MDTDTTPNTDPTADHTCSPACNYCNVPTPAYTTPNTDPTGGHTVDTETETTTERTAEWYRSLAAHCDCEASEATWNEQYETAETWRCAEHVWLLAARATEDGQTQAAEWLASVASQDQAAAEQAASDEDES